MKILEIELINYRNFSNEKIKFCPKTLVIGANDVGKTNLMYAIRLLLDRSLNHNDLEPKESDFNVGQAGNFFEISIKFDECEEDCIRSTFEGKISDDGILIIKYRAEKNKDGTKNYVLYCGYDEDSLEPIQSRFYLKYINFEYLKSNRNLDHFFGKEKRRIFENAKKERSETEIKRDAELIVEIESNLANVNSNISNISFVKKALGGINKEISSVSTKSNMKLSFDAGVINSEEYINDIDLIAEAEGQKIALGGDGTNNQLFITMWCPATPKDEEIEGVTIYGIEEPEAHLHPHNQRTLASYLYNKIKSQIIITSHSPQIASEFSPNSIIKLYSETITKSKVASGGCSHIIDDAFLDFGFRMNILPAEAFFSSCIFLVEGPTEVMFFKALAPYLNINLDKLNISILSVNGVGFAPYVNLFTKLCIPVVLRTDNDIIPSKKNKGHFHLSGLKRLYEYAVSYFGLNDNEEMREEIFRLYTQEELDDSEDDRLQTSNGFSDLNLFLSKQNLEYDMINSKIQEDLLKYYNVKNSDVDKLYKIMTKSKGKNMYKLIFEYSNCFEKLSNDSLGDGLKKCAEIANGS